MTGERPDPIGDGLRAFLAQRLGDDDLRVEDLRQHIEGFSWETYSLRARWTADGAERERGMIMHRVPTAGLLGPYDVQAQFELLSALCRVDGIPVVEPLYVEPEGTAVGRPMYVVDRAPGFSPTPWTVVAELGDERRVVGTEFAALGAAVHRAPRAALPADLPGMDAADPVEAVIDHWESQYRHNRLEAFPAGDHIFAWLRRNRSMASGRIGLVHGDFRVGNFIVRDGHLSVMLDWETAHIGDPVEDLACATAKGLRGGRLDTAGGLIGLDDFVAAYEEAIGFEVPRTAIQYWWVVLMASSVAQWLTAARHFESGRTRDARYPALGYQLAYQIKEAYAIIESLRLRRPPWPPAGQAG